MVGPICAGLWAIVTLSAANRGGMDHQFDTLILLAEITVAFVAFSAIVASLRVTLGNKLSPYEKLLVHFFTESGMLTASVAILPLVLWNIWPDEERVATYTIGYALVISGLYLIFYIRRRLRVRAPVPLPSLLNMIGYGVWLVVMAGTLLEIIFKPSLAFVSALVLWSLFSSFLLFAYFLSGFIDTGKKKE